MPEPLPVFTNGAPPVNTNKSWSDLVDAFPFHDHWTGQVARGSAQAFFRLEGPNTASG